MATIVDSSDNTLGSLYHRRAAGLFLYFNSVQAGKTDKAVSEMLKEIAGMRTSPGTPAELARQRTPLPSLGRLESFLFTDFR